MKSMAIESDYVQLRRGYDPCLMSSLNLLKTNIGTWSFICLVGKKKETGSSDFCATSKNQLRMVVFHQVDNRCHTHTQHWHSPPLLHKESEGDQDIVYPVGVLTSSRSTEQLCHACGQKSKQTNKLLLKTCQRH